MSLLKNSWRGLPWWLSGKEPTCQCRRQGFNPRSGKIPLAVEQLSPGVTTIEPALQSPGATTTEAPMPESLCSASGEATAMRSPRTATRK